MVAFIDEVLKNTKNVFKQIMGRLRKKIMCKCHFFVKLSPIGGLCRERIACVPKCCNYIFLYLTNASNIKKSYSHKAKSLIPSKAILYKIPQKNSIKIIGVKLWHINLQPLRASHERPYKLKLQKSKLQKNEIDTFCGVINIKLKEIKRRAVSHRFLLD